MIMGEILPVPSFDFQCRYVLKLAELRVLHVVISDDAKSRNRPNLSL
jgi:hypothetical protein